MRTKSQIYLSTMVGAEHCPWCAHFAGTEQAQSVCTPSSVFVHSLSGCRAGARLPPCPGVPTVRVESRLAKTWRTVCTYSVLTELTCRDMEDSLVVHEYQSTFLCLASPFLNLHALIVPPPQCT